MPPSRAAAVVFSVVALVLIWSVVFVFGRQYRVDALRHRLLGFQYQLFDLAAAGVLSFESSVYNAWLACFQQARRHVDRLTFTRVVLLLICNRFSPIFLAGETTPAESGSGTALRQMNEHVMATLLRHIIVGYALVGWLFPGARKRLERFSAIELVNLLVPDGVA